jgi:hypothetical protein
MAGVIENYIKFEARTMARLLKAEEMSQSVFIAG